MTKHPIYNVSFTIDYEIHGNGDGDPYKLMIEPTYRLLNLLDKYSAKLIIFADIAEILCFKKYFEDNNIDKFHYKEIETQLIYAIQKGHDVQLHIHSSYFKSIYNGKNWDQCIEEYSMAALSYERIHEMIKTCVNYLNNLLQPINPQYKCHIFRAANWSMMPTENIYKALVENGITIDSSVYKGGCQGGNVSYDYRNAYSNILAYPASNKDINIYDPEGRIIEYPIYTEMRYFWSFISPLRIFRMVRAKFHKHKKNGVVTTVTQEANKNDNRNLTLKSFFTKSPWKLDFNQASGFQMINALKRIFKLKLEQEIVNVVFIGHSKTYIPYNEKTLEKFLRYSKAQKQIKFGLLK